MKREKDKEKEMDKMGFYNYLLLILGWLAANVSPVETHKP